MPADAIDASATPTKRAPAARERRLSMSILLPPIRLFGRSGSVVAEGGRRIRLLAVAEVEAGEWRRGRRPELEARKAGDRVDTRAGLDAERAQRGGEDHRAQVRRRRRCRRKHEHGSSKAAAPTKGTRNLRITNSFPGGLPTSALGRPGYPR